MARFSANIHSIDTTRKRCIVTIMDGSEYILDAKNIGIELSPDGTANTSWIKENIKIRIDNTLSHIPSRGLLPYKDRISVSLEKREGT